MDICWGLVLGWLSFASGMGKECEERDSQLLQIWAGTLIGSLFEGQILLQREVQGRVMLRKR